MRLRRWPTASHTCMLDCLLTSSATGKAQLRLNLQLHLRPSICRPHYQTRSRATAVAPAQSPSCPTNPVLEGCRVNHQTTASASSLDLVSRGHRPATSKTSRECRPTAPRCEHHLHGIPNTGTYLPTGWRRDRLDRSSLVMRKSTATDRLPASTRHDRRRGTEMDPTCMTRRGESNSCEDAMAERKFLTLLQERG